MLGTLVWDRIRPHTESGGPASEPVESWGGIAYSLAAAAAYRPSGWEIVPLLKLGSDLRAEAYAFLRSLPVELGPGVQEVPEPNNRVELRYTDEANRRERLSGGVPPWRWPELQPLVADLDALFVNFISGYEMELADAQLLRDSFAGPIYADIHSLLLGRTEEGVRVRRSLPRWREWVRCFDAIQLNEDEFAALTGRAEDPWTAGDSLPPAGTRLLCVTCGEHGAAYAAGPGLPSNPLQWRSEPGGEAPAASAPRAVARAAGIPRRGERRVGDPTGCGDVWGPTLFTGLLGGWELAAAIERANQAAARNVLHSGASTLYPHLRDEPGAPRVD